ncbi:MAG TPA: 3-hydroxyacyl-CoA dehydrogenase NAD-binding domain-containing protein [Burkholderiales bacterium]|jgi:3-hydroxybutyryl-CoA dehydrogenase|nr:3-hydroxyacyl-CoA dehydrogenase NAD-binding domain-containing protein [Burkholderiales bacterium]
MKIVALGAGRMGRGIGQVFAYAGYDVSVVDFKPRPAGEQARLGEAGHAEISANLALLAELGLLDDDKRRQVAARVKFLALDEAKAALEAADVIFEGVTETLEAKRDAFARACRHARADAIVASTTSSMLADTLAALVPHPERFINAHFLNPAYLIPLVELSPAHVTAEATFRKTKDLLESAGKVVVRCAPSPGFIVPRLQAALMNEAVRLVEEGVATPEEIDRAVRSGLGPRYTAMGVCEFIDYGGVDILYYASRSMAQALQAPRYEPPALIARLMDEGKRGTREGEGLYDWRGRDVAAYQKALVGRYVALFRHLGLLRPPA